MYANYLLTNNFTGRLAGILHRGIKGEDNAS